MKLRLLSQTSSYKNKTFNVCRAESPDPTMPPLHKRESAKRLLPHSLRSRTE